MTPARFRFVLAAMALCALSPRIWGAAVDISSFEQTLKGKDLTKNGSLYVLSGESEVTTALKDLRTLKKKVDDEGKVRRDLEYKVKVLKAGISQLDFQRRALNEQLAKVTDAATNNHLIGRINVLSSQIDEARDVKGQIETKLNGLGTEDSTAFINGVVDVSAKVEDVQKKYKELAEDADVKGAIEQINQAGRGRVKLGPSPSFLASAAMVKRWRKDVNSDTIAVKVENNIPTVDVTLNGKVTRSMVIDSGASLVCLTADLAKQLDMVPTEKDQTIRMTLADGRQVEGKLMSLKSVRVGTFTVDDVDCAVLPETLTAAEPLLGGSFLQNFVYRMDQNAGELHLASIAGANKGITGGDKGKPQKMPKPDANKKN